MLYSLSEGTVQSNWTFIVFIPKSCFVLFKVKPEQESDFHMIRLQNAKNLVGIRKPMVCVEKGKT